METDIREIVWKQLIDYIDSEELFFPAKIRNQISEDAHEILDLYVSIMLDRGMLREFRKMSVINRIAFWFFKRRMRKQQQDDQLTEVYVKGPEWDSGKECSFQQLSGLVYGGDDAVH
jgi:hypothetical protein